LATLNEITRQLAGTLETEPLLQSILDSAVSILNCEAGSLFLVDETTGELVFKATAGPLADNLAGQRLAPGTGIAGEAKLSRPTGRFSVIMYSRPPLGLPPLIKPPVLSLTPFWLSRCR
jgi:GAF domain-containing protein